MDQRISDQYTPKECFFCKDNSSKYCCPRCNEQYCSLDCYKSAQHADCSESFYRECVTQEMTGYHVDEDAANKMKDILERMHNQDIDNCEDVADDNEEGIDSDDEECLDLQERIGAIDLDDADAVWNALTQDERNEFEALVSGGDIGKLVTPWEPWWQYRKESKLVEEVKCQAEEDAMKMCPKIKNVPDFSTISKTTPSEVIKHNITNTIASYAFVARHFNGELDGYEVVACLLSICGSLAKNSNYEDDATAISCVEQECVNSTIIDTDKNSLQIMKHDVYQILKGPSEENKTYYVSALLSSTHKLLLEAKKVSKTSKENKDFTKKFPEQGDDHLPELDLSKIKHILKKIEYYLAYVKCYGCS